MDDRRSSTAWTAAALVLLFASVVGCTSQAEALATWAATWTGRRPDAVGVLLGWAPAGGLSCLLAGLLVWRLSRLRHHLSSQRLVDRLGVAVVVAWAGLAAAFTPSRRGAGPGDFEQLVTIPGPSFARAAEWTARGLLVSVVLALAAVIGVAWRTSRRAETDRGFALVLLPWLAAATGLPAAALLAALLICHS